MISAMDEIPSTEYVFLLESGRRYLVARKIEDDDESDLDGIDLWIGSKPVMDFDDEVVIPLGVQATETRTPERLNREKFFEKTWETLLPKIRKWVD